MICWALRVQTRRRHRSHSRLRSLSEDSETVPISRWALVFAAKNAALASAAGAG